MFVFNDFFGNNVRFSYKVHPFSKQPKHVFVITKYRKKWLLTKHKRRGLEFPGGKVEAFEEAEEGAMREVWEETGGIIQELFYIGQYFVSGKEEPIIKNVYFGRVSTLESKEHYHETLGPVLIDESPRNIQHHSSYSFIMKDKVLHYSLDFIKRSICS